jgi:hypothetical protein
MPHHTPRVDIDATERTTGNFYYWDCNGTGGLVNTATTYRRRLIDQRPESQHNPKNGSGFRNPGTYYNYKKSFIAQPQGNVRCYAYYPTYCPHPGQYGYALTDGGFGWDTYGSDLPVIPTWLEDKAIAKAYANVKASKVNLSVAYAERKETAELFENTIKRISSGVRAFRRNNSSDVWKSVKLEGTSITKNGRKRWHKVPDHWLEMQYGWNPLMADVQGACKELQHNLTAGQRLLATYDGKANYSYEKRWTKSGPFTQIGQHVTDKVKQSIAFGLTYAQTNPLVSSLARLGITNPAEVIWERIPYSFVVDWFLPIGNWLSEFDADLGFDFYAGSRTEMTRVTGVGVPYAINEETDIQWYNDTTAYHFEGHSFGRSGLGAPPRVGWPHFKSPISSTHVANALSLLVGAFR